jgi:hypothetical protein
VFQSLKDDGSIDFNFIRFHKLIYIIGLETIKEFNKNKYHIIFTLLFYQIGLNIINNKKCKLDVKNSEETIYCYYSQLITTFKFYNLTFDTISIVIFTFSMILVFTILSILKIEQNEKNNYEYPIIDTTKENTTDITKEPLIINLKLIKSMIIIDFLAIIYALIIAILWIGVPIGIYVIFAYIIDEII